jgi:hypothetical protein
VRVIITPPSSLGAGFARYGGIVDEKEMARQLGVTLREFRRFLNVRFRGPGGVGGPNAMLGAAVYLEAREYFDEQRRRVLAPSHQAGPPTRR